MKKYMFKYCKIKKGSAVSIAIALIILYLILRENFFPIMFFSILILGCFTLDYISKKYIIKKHECDIREIDNMSGEEFENFLAKIYRIKGYKVIQTPRSSDYGADLVISRLGTTSCVQAKRYSGNVGPSAIQEVQASLKYYHASKGIVVTNSKFTANAIKLANVNHIDLIDRTSLMYLINSVKIK